MDFIKNHPFLASAPKEMNIASETGKDTLVVSSEIIADTTIPNNAIIETVAPKIETILPSETIEQTEVITPVQSVSVPEPEVMELPKVAPTFVPDSRHIFSDIPVNSLFYTATKYLKEAGVTHGYEDGGFHPNYHVSRSETVLLYDRLFTIGGTGIEVDLPFLDVLPSDELTQALTRAFARKIVAKSKYFRPNDSLTRAEAITLLVRTSGIPLDTQKYSLFQDIKTNNSHMVYINTFAKYLGIRGANFEPNKDITRGELAKILYVFDQKKQKESK